MIRFLKRILIVCAVAGIVGTSLGFILVKREPVAFRRWVFQPVREAVYFYKELDVLHRWRSIERVQIPEPEVVRIRPRDGKGIEMAAAIYRAQTGKTSAPLLIALHGSYPWGRKAGLIRLIGLRLSKAGWTVIAPDARGFGETDDPAAIDDPQSWRTDGDLRRVIDYWVVEKDHTPSKIVVLGHSMGANHALEGGLRDSRVDALILIGPGRYPNKIDERVPDWERARFSADRHLSAPISPEVARYTFSRGNIRLLVQSDLLKAQHKPIFLIDGELEGKAKLDYLHEIVSRIPGRITYRTLDGTGHYCGVRSFYGSETVYYQPAMFDPFLEMVLRFLNSLSG